MPADVLHISTFGRMRIHEVCVGEGLYAAENLTVELDVTQSSKAQMQKLKDGVWDIVHTNADNIDFLPFKDLEQSVRDDVTFLRNSPLIPKSIDISGFIYDVRSGKLLPVT